MNVRHWIWLLCLLLMPLSGASAAANDDAAATHFTQAARLVLPARAGAFASPAKTLAAAPDGAWTEVALPDVNMQRTPGHAAVGKVRTTWYRFALPGALRAEPQEVFFYLPRWQTIGQVALYGVDEAGEARLLWRSTGDLVWNGFNQPVWVSLDPPGQDRPRALLLSMDSVPGVGGGISSAWIGTQDALSWRWYGRMTLQVWLPLLMGACFLVLGVFSFAVWLKRRRESLYLLFAITALCFVARYLHFVTPLNHRLMPSAWFGWMTVWALSCMSVAMVLFAFRLCERRFPRFERILLSFLVLHGLSTLPPLMSSTTIAALSVIVYAALGLLMLPATYLTLRAAKQARSAAGILLGLAILLSLPLAMHDLMLASYRFSLEGVYLLEFMHILVFLIFASVLYRRYIDGIESLEINQETLERRLGEREKALEESYAKLREVEQRELLHKERRRLVRDMHDGLGGSLTGALRMIDGEHFERGTLHAALRDCMDELRLTMDTLEPVESDLSVLIAGLRFRLQPRIEAAGLILRWRAEALPPLPWLAPGHLMHVARIVQEVTTNIVKHAGASEIVFSTQAQDGCACIVIDADGAAFDGVAVAAARGQDQNRSRGLDNIAYRAGVLRGSAHWTRRAEGGMRFTLRLPLLLEGEA